MSDWGRLLWLAVGVVVGGVGVGYVAWQPQAFAYSDRSEDYIICTGAVAVSRTVPIEGVWLLDYKAGKLLGTIVNRGTGKVTGWAEMDLVSEFGLPPRQNVHFLMTTGMIANGQAALYLAETTSGKFGVYTMGVRPDGKAGVMIKRHDQVMFRKPRGE